MLEFRDELQAEVTLLAAGYKRLMRAKPPIPFASRLAEDWERVTSQYDELNEPLPVRYRKTLDDRFDARIVGTSGIEKGE